MKGIEPPTPSLPWKCSTPELHWLIFFKIASFAKAERVKRLEPSTLSLEG